MRIGRIEPERIARAAPAALAAVLLIMTAFALWSGWTTSSAADRANRSVELRDAYADAQLAVVHEEALERRYRIEPEPAIRTEFAAAAAEFDRAMQLVRSIGGVEDRAFADDMLRRQADYLNAIDQVFDAMDRGDTQAAASIDDALAEPHFAVIESAVGEAADAQHAEADAQLRSLRSAERLFTVATPIVFAVGLGILAIVWGAMRAYQRQVRLASRNAAERELEHVKATAEAERHAIAQSEQRFRTLVHRSTDIVAIIDADTTVRYVGPSVERVLGYQPADLIEANGFGFDHPDDLPRLQEFFATILATPGGYSAADLHVRHADGSWRWLEVVATNLLADPVIGGIVLNCHDITERKKAEQELIQEQDLLRRLMDSLPDLVFFKDVDSRFLRINRAGAALLGLKDPAEAVGKSDRDFVTPDIAAAYLTDDRRVMTSRTAISDHLESIVVADGTVRWLSTSKAPTFDTDGVVTGIVGVSRDVTDRKALEEQLAHQAFHDSLTGLPNRLLFANRLEHALERTARTADAVAVLFLDLDGFKLINDSLGHGQGDILLLAVADRLRMCVRPGDTVARLGGDEFIVLLEDTGAEEATRVAERIGRRLAMPIDLNGRAVVVSASIGIACKTSPFDDADALLSNADVAMYAAKQNGKAQFALFDPGMHTRAWERFELEADLRRAIERNEFRVFYQPIVDLTNGQMSEVEALVRWEHPERGLVGPGEFIPLAEETGMILPIGRWVLAEACRQVQSWRVSLGESSLAVSVNLSPRMFKDPGLVDDVARTLMETELDPACLKLEITEGSMVQDGDSAIGVLRRLKALGVRIAIDDFGTGYSSLAYLQRLPVDVVKIDRSFIARLGHDAESLEIVRLIIGLAKTLGLIVVGEGVETDAQLALLRDLGSDCGQGFLFDRPLSAEATTARFQQARVGRQAPPAEALATRP